MVCPVRNHKYTATHQIQKSYLCRSSTQIPIYYRSVVIIVIAVVVAIIKGIYVVTVIVSCIVVLVDSIVIITNYDMIWYEMVCHRMA